MILFMKTRTETMKPKRCNQSGSSQTSQGSTGNDDYNEAKIRSITRLRDKLNQKHLDVRTLDAFTPHRSLEPQLS